MPAATHGKTALCPTTLVSAEGCLRNTRPEGASDSADIVIRKQTWLLQQKHHSNANSQYTKDRCRWFPIYNLSHLPTPFLPEDAIAYNGLLPLYIQVGCFTTKTLPRNKQGSLHDKVLPGQRRKKM